jgi:hypothetical protein
MPRIYHTQILLPVLFTALLILAGCSNKNEQNPGSELPLNTPPDNPAPTKSLPEHEDLKQTEPATIAEDDEHETLPEGDTMFADVVSVAVSGLSNQYQFSVGISSPDTGCEQYADWWEVLDEDGNLIYRRILIHSHVNQQPFTRSGGPVDISPDATVYIRAHMNPAGFGGNIMKGSVDSGFIFVDIPPDFSPEIEKEPPLPTGCNF